MYCRLYVGQAACGLPSFIWREKAAGAGREANWELAVSGRAVKLYQRLIQLHTKLQINVQILYIYYCTEILQVNV